MARPLLLALLVSGCTQFPELDRAVSPEARAAPAPEIVDLDPLLAGLSDETAESRQAETLARASALRARAAALAPAAPDGAGDADLAARRARLAAERDRAAE